MPVSFQWLPGPEHQCLIRTRGQQETPAKNELPDYDVKCYLCPGNKRAQGDLNPSYEATFAFVNDYSAVKEDQAEYNGNEGGDGARFCCRRRDARQLTAAHRYRRLSLSR